MNSTLLLAWAKPTTRAVYLSVLSVLLVVTTLCLFAGPAAASTAGEAQHKAGGEANLILPDLSQVQFLGMSGSALLMWGLLVAILGLVFGLVNYMRVAKLPVHPSMREVSQLIWETCKTYLVTQGKFLLILEIFIGIIILLYFGVLLGFEALRVAVILAFSLVGIAGSYGVAWFGIRINTQANSRTAFASLSGKPLPLSRSRSRRG